VEQRWVIPVEETTLGVEELLPQGVALQNGDFEIGVDAASVSASLGDLCSGCGPLDGTPVSDMPPFTGQIQTTQGLPADVEGGVVSGGSLQLGIENGLSFDPIDGGGSVTLSVSDDAGGDVLAQVTLHGDTAVLASGSTFNTTVGVDPATVGSTLRIEAEIVSVGGQSGTIDVNEQITVTLSSATLLLSEVTIDVGTTAVDFESVQLDVADFDTELTDRIREGAIILDVTNPFAVSVSGDLQIGPTSKPFTVDPSGPSALTLTYTGDELRSFLGSDNITLSGSGTATGGIITVSADQEIRVNGDLDLTLEVGGDAESLFNN